MTGELTLDSLKKGGLTGDRREVDRKKTKCVLSTDGKLTLSS